MELDEWLRAAAAELDLEDVDFSSETVHTLLDLARDSAHEIERIAAPLTTYLIGVAVGRGATLGAAAARLTELALHRPPVPPPPPPPPEGKGPDEGSEPEPPGAAD